jgi:lipid-A-disaccharide synthase
MANAGSTRSEHPPGAPRIFLSAGEASGEHYGTLLIEAIRRLAPEATFFGLGGQRMEAAGLKRVVRAEDVAVMGITEVIRHMPHIYGEYRKLKRSLAAKPYADVAVLIDFPDVNLGLARHLHRLQIPVVFFVSPQLWAWKKHRIRQVQRYVDRMLVIFPFEEKFYEGHSVAATFVGHPLADLPQPGVSREDFARKHSLDPVKNWIALLPGSRGREIKLNLPTMLEAAEQLGEDAEFLIPLAPTLTASHRTEVARLIGSSSLRKIRSVDDARGALFHARASVVASGTATVEAALIGNPFLVVYRISSLSYSVAKRVVKVPFVAMVNLIAGREVVPELIQGDFTSANVVLHLRRLMHNERDRKTMREGLCQVAEQLRGAGSDDQKQKSSEQESREQKSREQKSREQKSREQDSKNQESKGAIARVAETTLESIAKKKQPIELSSELPIKAQ